MSHLPGESSDYQDAVSAYRCAHAVARKSDVYGWRQLLRLQHQNYAASLREWRTKHEGRPPRELDEVEAVADGLVESGAGLMAAALGALESGQPGFQDHRETFLQLLRPVDWERGASAALVDGPYALGFVFHGLHGAVSLRLSDPGRAIRLAETLLPSNGRVPQRACERPELMGWSATYGQNCALALGYLLEGFGRWDWLSALFASDRGYREAIVGYYLLLNTRELARRLARGEDVSQVSPNVPLAFGSSFYEVADGAFLCLLRAEGELDQVWEGVGVTKDRMEEAWEPWLAAQGAAHRVMLMPHHHLFDALR